MMKTKLDLAHDYAMLHMVQDKYKDVDDFEMVKWAVDYADAMFKELEMREKSEQLEKRNKFRELLNSDNTFIEREWQHFDDIADIQKTYSSSEEWQPDWSQAPEWAKWFAVDKNNDGYFYSYKPNYDDEHDYWYDIDDLQGSAFLSDSFGYTGDWKNSLRERPND